MTRQMPPLISTLVAGLFLVSTMTTNAEDVYWVGLDADDSWSIPLNWSSNPLLPGAQDDVFHADPVHRDITFDLGSPAAPETINSFTPLTSSTATWSLTLESLTGLKVKRKFQPPLLSPNALFDLTLQAGAKLEVGDFTENDELAWMNVVLEQGIDGDNRTEIVVNGAVGESVWTVNRFTVLSPMKGMVLRGYPDNSFSVSGEIISEGPIWCGNDWTIAPALGQTEPPRVEVKDCPFEVAVLNLSGNARVLLTDDDQICSTFPSQLDLGDGYPVCADYGYDPVDVLPPAQLRVFDALMVDASYVQTDSATLIAEPGSTITVSNGGSVAIGTVTPAAVAIEIGSLVYGGFGGNSFFAQADGGLVFRDEDSTLKPDTPGVPDLFMTVYGGLDMASKIHDVGLAGAWDASAVYLFFVADDLALPFELEAVSPDYGGTWFADSDCIKPWETLEVECVGASCAFSALDNRLNANGTVMQQLGGPEAIYVDGDVKVNVNATMSGVAKIYHTGEYAGPPLASIIQVEQTLFGDWNNDCQITSRELREIQALVHAGGYDPLMDLECDGDVESLEVKRVEANMKLQPPCAGVMAAFGTADDPLTVGERSELAASTAATMSAGDAADFAADLNTTAGTFAGTELGTELALFAEAIERAP